MKRIIGGILFLIVVALKFSATDARVLPEFSFASGQVPKGKITVAASAVIDVVITANEPADISFQQSNSFTAHHSVRRYPQARLNFGRLLLLCTERCTVSAFASYYDLINRGHHCLTILQKCVGYYVFALRRILI